ncbi:hypothetical protein D9758_003634 [Tetrapyrgos nigripes]|uniref:Uncharacterized protein n=1 Tax=Tetrapyrgos nigripes TaxID=182062 RepID=A0A8H5LS55_9AGAR|nr:hypothetical protein D9758_003634 [Tetrapyrgos nigripes]
MHDNDPELLEKEKRRNLNREQHQTSAPFGKDAPGWNEHLASASEAHVKADRSTGNPKELQAETVEYIRRRHSPEDHHQEASYTKDEVEGPLGSSSRDQVDGPLGSAGHHDRIVKKTIHETIYEHNDEPTSSEETVKAERGEV